MRTIIGGAIGTIVFWLTIVADTIAYILDHIFAIGLGTAVAFAVILVGRVSCRRHHRCQAHRRRPAVSGPAPHPRYTRPPAATSLRATSPTLHSHRKVSR
jgi:hypothetical protein